jgi:hypothetical protein
VSPKPTLGAPPPRQGPKINAGIAPQQQLWAFSFRYFREMPNFGVGAKSAGWFVAMLDKLGELSRKTIASINANPAEKLAWRFHEIDWESKNIPVQRNSLDWIDHAYLDNEDEYPIHQFQITKALGRVVGFFDERRIFNVVLLDPMHNVQPSDYSDYKVRATIVTESVAAGVLRFVEQRIGECQAANCQCRIEYANIQKILTENDGGTSLLVHVSRELFDRVAGCVTNGTADSIGSIIGASMDSLER